MGLTSRYPHQVSENMNYLKQTGVFCNRLALSSSGISTNMGRGARPLAFPPSILFFGNATPSNKLGGLTEGKASQVRARAMPAVSLSPHSEWTGG